MVIPRWPIYNDRCKHSQEPPPPESIARQVRITPRGRHDTVLPPDVGRITGIIATEITHHGWPLA
jgi:hypothetical protein